MTAQRARKHWPANENETRQHAALLARAESYFAQMLDWGVIPVRSIHHAALLNEGLTNVPGLHEFIARRAEQNIESFLSSEEYETASGGLGGIGSLGQYEAQRRLQELSNAYAAHLSRTENNGRPIQPARIETYYGPASEGGSYNPRNGILRVNLNNSPEEILNTVAHENQHHRQAFKAKLYERGHSVAADPADRLEGMLYYANSASYLPPHVGYNRYRSQVMEWGAFAAGNLFAKKTAPLMPQPAPMPAPTNGAPQLLAIRFNNHVLIVAVPAGMAVTAQAARPAPRLAA